MKQVQKSVKKNGQQQKRQVKKMKQVKVQASPPKPETSALTRTLVIIGIVVLLVAGALLYRLGSVGKATLEAPSNAVINLDVVQVEDLNVANDVLQAQLMVTPSKETAAQEYTLSLSKHDDGSLSYTLTDANGALVAQELLTATVGGGDIYLPGDDLADLKVSYTEHYFRILDLNYKEPEVVAITALQADGKEVSGQFVFATAGKSVVLLFKASSSNAPLMTAQWENGTVLSSDEFSQNVTDTTFTTMSLNWTPSVDGANVLLVKGQVGDKTTTKRYVVAVGNILYELKEDGLPHLVVKKKAKSNAAEVTFTFPKSATMQPFSLPCGEGNLVDGSIPPETLNKIVALSSYDGEIKQWKKETPSEFDSLQVNTGYFLQRSTDDGDIVLSVTCNENLLTPPDSSYHLSQPALHKGWNLIGINGYEPVTVDALSVNTPSSSSISLVYAVDNNGVDTTSPIIELSSGRVYWVKVE